MWQIPIMFVGTLLIVNKKLLEMTPRVETTYGPIMGEQVYSPVANYKAFRGIRYAEAPTGDLRFRDPVPPQKWTQIKQTNQFGSICPQAPSGPAPATNDEDLGQRFYKFITHAQNFAKVVRQLLKQSEDCLSLNVYTVHLGESDLRPVLVWFHGGGFYSGDGTDALYGPEYLVTEDIVIVTANYRLGPLGFLSTNTSDASGNWGLKDQAAVLRWVRDNIDKFGGDPDQVTIYGESAGGASIHYHLLSPLSKGLFHRAIVSSGAATCDWALNDQQERLSRNLARLSGASEKEIADPALRVQHLRKINGKTLTNLIWRSMEELEHKEKDGTYDTERFIPFVPVVEPRDTPGAFLTEDPKVLMSEGRFHKVPVMIGFNDLDGGVLFTGPSSNISSAKQLQKEVINPCSYLPKDLRDALDKESLCPDISRDISQLYFDGLTSSNSPLGFVRFFGDRAIIHSLYTTQKWFAKHAGKDNPAFFYYFTYDGEWNLVKDIYSIDLPGVTHWDELVYVFRQKLKPSPPLRKDSLGYLTHKRMIRFISNFVKYGTPTPVESPLYIPWEPANEIEHNTLVIGSELKMEKNLLKERMDFWNALYNRFTSDSFYQ